MKGRILLYALAAATVGAAATPALAQDYPGYGDGYYDGGCHAQERQSGTTGAVLGGVGGALLGSSLAGHHSGRGEGAVVGGIAGALLGNSIGRSAAKSSDACQDRDYGDAYYGRAPYAYAQPAYRPRYVARPDYAPGYAAYGVAGHPAYDWYGPDPNGAIAPDGHRIKCKLIDGRRECW
jgi:hypothetical protein